jgi:peroxiredoxin
LRQDYAQFIARGAEVLVIGPKDRTTLARYWEQEQLPFVGLADPDHQVADLYRQEVSLRKLGRMPALLLVDREGQVRFQRYGNAMQDIVPNDDVLKLLDKLNHEQASTKNAARG